MNNKIITNLINNFELERFGPNHILYEENSEGDKFYIIKEGTLEEKFSNSPNIKNYRENDTIGDLALLEKGQREGTITTKDNVTLLSVSLLPPILFSLVFLPLLFSLIPITFRLS